MGWGLRPAPPGVLIEPSRHIAMQILMGVWIAMGKEAEVLILWEDNAES